MSEILDWIFRDEEPYIIFEDATPSNTYIPHIRRGVDEAPRLTPAEEESLMIKQVTESKGFDIEFEKFRCIFNYLPFDVDSTYFLKNGRELMDRLSREALEIYNSREETEYKFVKFIKANHVETPMVPTEKFYITFEGKDPSSDESKHFQAKVIYYHCQPAEYHYCDLKPEKKVHSIETEEKENVKKPRLAEWPLTLGGEMKAINMDQRV